MSAIALQEVPRGSIEICTAPAIRKGHRIISKGTKTTRVNFELLPEENYRISGSLAKCCHFGSVRFPMFIDGAREYVWLNLQSLIKRFNLPEKVILKASEDCALHRIVQLVQDKAAFQRRQNPSTSTDEDGKAPMLSSSNIELLPLSAIAHQAKDQQRSIHLSAEIYGIPNSVNITRDGFIAISKQTKIGNGGNAVVRKSVTHDGVPIVRRICNDPKTSVRLFRNLELFKGKKGIINTFSTDIYVDEMGKTEAVSYHPVFEKDLFDVFVGNDLWSDADALEGAHHLLIGLVEIAKKGMHGDLTADNVLVRRVNKNLEIVISDLETFSTYEDAQGILYISIWAAPETIKDARTGKISAPPNEKRDVWPVGVMLHCIFLMPKKKREDYFRWLLLRKWELPTKAPKYQTQEKIDAHIASTHFPPALETLLKGMLQVDPNQRWTAHQALEFFKENIL